MSTITFGNAAKKFTAAGIKGKWLLPIAPVGAQIGKNSYLSDKVLGKAPGRWHEKRAVWSGLTGRAIFDGVTKDEFDDFQSWPTGNVGVLGRAFPAIDSDAESEDARRLVEKTIARAFGKDAVFAERIRGKGPRRLYAFKCTNPKDMDSVVRGRHLSYKMPGDETEHKLDILGLGNQYVAAGTHPSGDEYQWNKDDSLLNADCVSNLTEIDNVDIDNFLEVFTDLLEEIGGEISRKASARGNGFEANVKDLEPVMTLETVMEGLDQLPNTEENFLHRDDFVAALSAIRSALGKETLHRDVEDEIYKWATVDPDWCDDDYFEKVWVSLDTVRTPQDSLDRLFRRNGIRHHVKDNFDDKAPVLSKAIKQKKQAATDDRAEVLDTVNSRYVFGNISIRTGNTRYTMRSRWNVESDWPVLDWWKHKLAESDHDLLNQIQDFDQYGPNEVGMANFLRDLKERHPDSFYSLEVKHPAFERGDIIPEKLADGQIRYGINTRFLSQTIRAAKQKDKNPERSREDVAHLLDFANRLFGSDMVEYELDTLAYMAQTGDRPGSMLFLVGESGVGKSLWLEMQATMFDGTGPDQTAIIDGQKLHNDSARRFMFAKAEGCRIMSVRELPDGAGARDMAAITSMLKQIEDAGPAGDWLQIERKGVDAVAVPNHARVNISSNYTNALHVEKQDRRIFYVSAKITEGNKPSPKFYEHVADIIESPERLAAFWRYLMARQIGNYSRHTAPPVSVEKAERVLADIANPSQRHLQAVIEWMRAAERRIYTSASIMELMVEVAEAEFVNSNGEIDDRYDYVNGAAKDNRMLTVFNSMRKISSEFMMKLDRRLGTATKRFPAIYIRNPNKDELHAQLSTMDKDRVFDMVEDADAAGMPPHPMAMFRKQ